MRVRGAPQGLQLQVTHLSQSLVPLEHCGSPDLYSKAQRLSGTVLRVSKSECVCSMCVVLKAHLPPPSALGRVMEATNGTEAWREVSVTNMFHLLPNLIADPGSVTWHQIPNLVLACFFLQEPGCKSVQVRKVGNHFLLPSALSPFLHLLPRPQVPAKPQRPPVPSQLAGSPACPTGSWGAGTPRTENGRGRRAFSTAAPTCAEAHSLHPSGC